MKLYIYFDYRTSETQFTESKTELKPIRNIIQEILMLTYKQILKNDFDIYIFNKSENHVSITFL